VRAKNRVHGADTPVTVVIEIDQPNNFRDEEAIVREIAKSRLLMRQGWRCFRFHIAEIEKLSPQELYWETESCAPC
jgi:very-short-patch-repair endonuclease